MLVQALSTQLTNQRFPGSTYFVAMVRRVLIDRKLPADWLRDGERPVAVLPGDGRVQAAHACPRA